MKIVFGSSFGTSVRHINVGLQVVNALIILLLSSHREKLIQDLRADLLDQVIVLLLDSLRRCFELGSELVQKGFVFTIFSIALGVLFEMTIAVFFD